MPKAMYAKRFYNNFYLEIDDALNIETKPQFIISPNHIYSTLYQTLKGNIFHG